jgi:uncharacterized protein YukE
MMADNVLKLVYAEADQMIALMKQTAELLQDTISEADSIAAELENGVLVGEAGQRFSDGLRSQFKSATQRLADVFTDGARYVTQERDQMMEAEANSAKLF